MPAGHRLAGISQKQQQSAVCGRYLRALRGGKRWRALPFAYHSLRALAAADGANSINRSCVNNQFISSPWRISGSII